MANITKRNSSYLIRVSAGLDSSGKQRMKSMTWKPEQAYTPKQLEKELNKVAAAFEEKVKNGLESDNPKLTLAQFAPQYLAIKKDTLSPVTYEKYRRTLERLILPQLGHLKLNAVKPIHIQNFIKDLSQTECVYTMRNGVQRKSNKTPSASTVKRYLAIIQSIFAQAVKLDLIQTNPAKAEKLTIPKAAKAKIEIFTKQETAQMLECLENEPLQYQVLIHLAIMTGARRGELAALKFSDIDINSQKITIERAAIKIPSQPIQIKPPKDFEVRAVTIPQYLIDMIQELKAEKLHEAQMIGDMWTEGDWIFTQWNGEIMNPMTPTKWFSKFLEKYGLPHRKFHSLRHTSATLLLYGGASIKQVQGRLGHGDIETTNKYLHYIAEADSESANILQNMLITHKQTEKQAKQA